MVLFVRIQQDPPAIFAFLFQVCRVWIGRIFLAVWRQDKSPPLCSGCWGQTASCHTAAIIPWRRTFTAASPTVSISPGFMGPGVAWLIHHCVPQSGVPSSRQGSTCSTTPDHVCVFAMHKSHISRDFTQSSLPTFTLTLADPGGLGPGPPCP